VILKVNREKLIEKTLCSSL